MNPGLVTQGQRLAAEAAAAAEVRGYQTDPDVVALRVERVRAQVVRLIWVGMVLGLCFTMVNVQQFAAGDAVAGSLGWWAAWLLDPMVSLVLLGVLRAEQITARWQVRMGPWPRVAKWVLLAGTYVMNTWASWAAVSPSGIVLHSVPVLTVFVAAEAVTDCQDKLTECVHRAHTWATDRAQRRAQTGLGTQAVPAGLGAPAASSAAGGSWATAPVSPVPVGAGVPPAPGQDIVSRPGSVPAGSAVSESPAPAGRERPGASGPRVRPAGGRRRARTSGRRVLFADYLASAQAALSPEVEVSPAWVREVTGCSRGLSSRLAAALRTDHHPVPAAVGPGTAEQTVDQSAIVDRPQRPEGKAA